MRTAKLRWMSARALGSALLCASALAQSPVYANWRGLTISSDGNRLAAVGATYDSGRGMTVGSLYTSGDGSNTWQYNAAFGDHNFTDLAGSSSGMILLAATDNGLFKSTDAGATWAATVVGASWIAVAVSSDGGALLASSYNYTGIYGYSFIWYSINGGTSWRSASMPCYGSRVLLSADGSIIVVIGCGQLLVSTDGGATYAYTGILASSAAMSASGATMAAFSNVNVTASQIRVSTDVGKTFGSPTILNATNYGTFYATAVMSAGGSRIAAGTVGGAKGTATFFVSASGGASWTALPSPTYYFSCMAGNTDAMMILAGTAGGTMYLTRDGGTTWSITGTAVTRSMSVTPSSGISPTSSRSAAATSTPAPTPGHSNGASCYLPSDCASGNCNQGICSPPPPSVSCESAHLRVRNVCLGHCGPACKRSHRVAQCCGDM